jgi:hypothetical protein
MNYFQTENVATDVKQFIEQLLTGLEHPTMTHTVKELLWGYQDEVLYQIQQLSPAAIPTTIVSIFNESVIRYLYIYQTSKIFHSRLVKQD